MKIVIFLGPSLSLAEGKKILPQAIFEPPAQQSDILSVLHNHRPDIIGLIDGVFEQSLSVWHKEILYALDRGIRIYGASSMGALRAAECAEFGMIGVGQVFQMFASGELNNDDEVALVHGPEESGYYGISEPMVNIRMTFQKAWEDDVIDKLTGEKLIDIAESLFFHDRKFPVIFEKALESGIEPEIIERMKVRAADHYVDIKAKDAIELLQTISQLPEELPQPEKKFQFTRNHLFNSLYFRDRKVKHNDADISLASIANYVAIHMPDFNRVNFNSLNRQLVLVLADLLKVEVTEEQIESEKKRFLFSHRLLKPEDFVDWLRRNDLLIEEFMELMKEMAIARKLHHYILTRNSWTSNKKFILDELRLIGQYEEWVKKAANQQKILDEDLDDYYNENERVSMKQLIIEHLQETPCKIDTHFAEWSNDSGFLDPHFFRIELLRARRERALLKNKVSDIFGLDKKKEK